MNVSKMFLFPCLLIICMELGAQSEAISNVGCAPTADTQPPFIESFQDVQIPSDCLNKLTAQNKLLASTIRNQPASPSGLMQLEQTLNRVYAEKVDKELLKIIHLDPRVALYARFFEYRKDALRSMLTDEHEYIALYDNLSFQCSILKAISSVIGNKDVIANDIDYLARFLSAHVNNILFNTSAESEHSGPDAISVFYKILSLGRLEEINNKIINLNNKISRQEKLTPHASYDIIQRMLQREMTKNSIPYQKIMKYLALQTTSRSSKKQQNTSLLAFLATMRDVSVY